jgi:hypothetical protein
MIGLAGAVVKFMVRPFPDMDNVGLACPHASIVPSEQVRAIFYFTEYFSFGARASATRSKEKYSVRQFAVFGNRGVVVDSPPYPAPIQLSAF